MGCDDGPVISHVQGADLAAALIDGRAHFIHHYGQAEKGDGLAAPHGVETCTHVFHAPSGVLAVINVDPDSFSHGCSIAYFFIFL